MADRMRVPRKEKQWGFLPGVETALTADATVGLASLAFSSKQTVLRMIGSLLLTPTGTVTALDSARIVFAIGRVSTDAATLGATALPDPAGEPEYPWLYWTTMQVRFASSGAPATGRAVGGSMRESFDIRSMRKFSPGESLISVVQYVDRVGAPALTLDQSEIRVLLTIH